MSEATGYNAKFVYPQKGGIEALPRAIVQRIAPVRLNSAPNALHLGERWLETNGDRIYYRRMISSIPLPELLKIALDLPESIRQAASWFTLHPVALRKLRHQKESSWMEFTGYTCQTLNFPSIGLAVPQMPYPP